MDDRRIQFRVGVMIVATILITGILTMLFGSPLLQRRTYAVHIKFPDAAGLRADTPVRMSGIIVGRVSQVAFDETEGVVVTAELGEDIRLPRSQRPQIVGSLLGDVELHFVQGDKGAGGVVEEGEVLRGRVASNPLQTLSDLEPAMNKALASMTTAGEEVTRLARGLNVLLSSNDEGIARVVTKTEQTLDSIQAAMNSVNDVVGDDRVREDLKRTVAGLPRVLTDADQAINNMSKLLNSIDKIATDLQGVSGPLRDRGPELINGLADTVGQLEGFITQLNKFTVVLNSREGSLGQLINDPELYQSLNSAAKNIDALTKELKPIVRDARVFTDKIARHPETLGVRGAIKPNSGIK